MNKKMPRTKTFLLLAAILTTGLCASAHAEVSAENKPAPTFHVKVKLTLPMNDEEPGEETSETTAEESGDDEDQPEAPTDPAE